MRSSGTEISEALCDNRFLAWDFCKNLGNSLAAAGEVLDLYQGITLIDVNSRQNLGLTISF